MKITTAVLATAALVLLQLVQMPLADHDDDTPTSATTDATSDAPSYYGYCPRVDCPYGYYLDEHSCKCLKKTDSYCPTGFDEFYRDSGHCSCIKKIEPECKEGFYLNDDDCKCKFKRRPECPDYTRLWKYGGYDYCVGKHDPECPKGAWLLDNCTCSLEIVRKCERGYLSADGCKCIEATEPECDDHNGHECQLNKRYCRCERRPNIWCYGRRYCRGGYRTVGHRDECCTSDDTNNSYRYNGRCYYC